MVWPALRSGCALEADGNVGRRKMVVHDRTRLIGPPRISLQIINLSSVCAATRTWRRHFSRAIFIEHVFWSDHSDMLFPPNRRSANLRQGSTGGTDGHPHKTGNTCGGGSL